VQRLVKLSAQVPGGQLVTGLLIHVLVTLFPQVVASHTKTQVRLIYTWAKYPDGHYCTQRPVVLSPKVLEVPSVEFAAGHT